MTFNVSNNGKHYSDISFRTGDKAGLRYTSGLSVYDEAMIDNRLVGRYWNACGQIWPEMHLPDENFQRNSLPFPFSGEFPLEAFRVSIGGSSLKDGWSFIQSGEMQDNTGLKDENSTARTAFILLSHDKYPVDVRVCTRLDGTEWFVRWLEIRNRGEEPLAITSVYPMSGRIWQHRHNNLHLSYGIDEVIDESFRSPFELAYNHLSDWGQEGDIWFEPLKPGVTRVDGGEKGKSGWSRPAFWLKDILNGHTFVCEYAWSGNWNISFDYLDNPENSQVAFAIGMSCGEGEVLRVLEPGEMITTPMVHFAQFLGSDDSIVQSLHQHVRYVVMPDAPAGRDIEIEANHRGYLCDRENERDIKKDIDIAAAAGAEIYVIDAGWYGNEPNQWWNNTGDWFAGAWLENGLEPISEYAHSRGMKFGLWMELEAAGANSALLKANPNWTMKRFGEDVAGSRALDLSKPEVIAWLESNIERMIVQYKLDMFRIDHNNNIGHGGNCERHGFCENVLWRYYEAFYGMFDRLLRKFPNVVFQNCAGGGGRLDIGVLQRFHNTELSDWTRQPRGTRIFNGLTMAIPPEVGLRTFGTEVTEHIMESDIDFQMRTVCICRPIFRGIAPSMEELNPLLKERINYHLELFKSIIRPLMRDCLVYHHTPWLPILKSSQWCVLEYGNMDRSRSVAAIFRLSPENKNRITLNIDARSNMCDSYMLYPRGLKREFNYRIQLDNSGDECVISGHVLMNQGLRVYLPGSLASELVIFMKAD